MATENYYNWDEILAKFDDKELYTAFVSTESKPEKKNAAEKILLKRGIISKKPNGIYEKEEIEKEHLYAVAHNFKNDTKENLINKLISQGLNKPSSIKLVDSYINWKEKKMKLIKPWLYICPPVMISAIILDYFILEMNILVGILGLPFVLFFGINYPTLSNFTKKTYFKILSEPE